MGTLNFSRCLRQYFSRASVSNVFSSTTIPATTDSPVTPIGSLHVAWTAVNRIIPSGEILGPEERISVAEALRAVTLGGAWQLRMEDEIGSISPRKFADCAVLDADPFEVDPMELRDIPVWGTMSSGVLHEGAARN